MRPLRLAAAFFAISSMLIPLPSRVRAFWPLEGTLLCDYSGPQYDPVIVEDGTGGAIVVWRDRRYDNYDIFAQRIDGAGNVLWNAGGVPVCTVTGTKQMVAAAPDGAGGAVIAWSDLRGTVPDIYAQRIDSSGARLWNTAGVSVCSAANDQLYPRIVPDGTGGGIIVWEDLRNGDNEIYARRVDGSGNVLWTIWGVLICSNAGYPLTNTHQIAVDGDGGAYIVWCDYRDLNYDVFYEHVASDGTLSFGSDGGSVCALVSAERYPSIHDVAPGAVVIAWWDYRGAHGNLFAQLFDGTTAEWGYNGLQLTGIDSGTIGEFTISGNAQDGVTVCWINEIVGQDGIYAQHVDIEGTLCWDPAGVTVYMEPGHLYQLRSVSDADGGALVFWRDPNPLGTRVYAQRIDRNGSLLWDPDGVDILPQSNGLTDPAVIADGRGGAIAAWEDARDGLANPPDIFAQRIDRNGYIASPEPSIAGVLDVPDDQGGRIEVRWDASYLDPWPHQEITHYSVWKSLGSAAAMLLAGGDERTFTELSDVGEDFSPAAGDQVIRREMLNGTAYYWELVATQTAQYYEGYSEVVDTDFDVIDPPYEYTWYQVAAHAADPLAVWTSAPDSGYSVDNLAPSMPLGLAGEQEYEPGGLDLSWLSNTEEDLSHYAVYRGTFPTFVPSASTLLGSVADTLYFDGDWDWESGYWYKVSAVDIHGNESLRAVLGPDMVTGDEPGPLPGATFLAQNLPNPFNPSTTVAFGLAERARVSLRVYDAAGRLVATLADGTYPAGRHSVAWDGRTTDGTRAASGVYFYRLRAGAFERTRKMILLQ